MSHHPPHLITKDGRMMPSAFIPFCSFVTDMEVLGQHIANLTPPVCTSFSPAILEGQLCYEIDLNLALPRDMTTGEGMEKGLMIILDSNGGRTGRVPEDLQFSKTIKPYPVPELLIKKTTYPKVYIHTVSRYSDYLIKSSSSTVMKMIQAKQVSVSEAFLDLPDETKQCQIETFEACQQDTLIREALDQCRCVPFALNGTFPQTHRICTPQGNECIESINRMKTQCMSSCNGMFADIKMELRSKGDAFKDISFKTKLKIILDDYKAQFGSDIVFDPLREGTVQNKLNVYGKFTVFKNNISISMFPNFSDRTADGPSNGLDLL